MPDKLESIGSGAFSGCGSLDCINIPASVTSIAYEAFEAGKYLNSVYGIPGSYAEQYAKERNIIFVPAVDEDEINGDITGDGKLDSRDLAAVQKAILEQ